jgi:hypothetical protein
MNFTKIQDFMDDEIMMDWNLFVDQLPESNQRGLNHDLIEIDSVFNQLTEQFINEPNQLSNEINESSKEINESMINDFNHMSTFKSIPITTEPIQVDGSLIGVKQEYPLLDPNVDTSLLNQEFDFDALLDLSWFIPEEMILDHGEFNFINY